MSEVIDAEVIDDTPPPSETTTIVKFHPAESQIAAWKKEFAGLTIVPGDEESYAIVRSARMTCVKGRTSIDKVRLSANEDDNKRIKVRNAEAKRLTALIAEVEKPLEAEQDREDKRRKDAAIAVIEEARRKEEAERAEVARKIKEAQDAENARLKAIADDLAAKRAEFDRQQAEAKRIADAEKAKADEEKRQAELADLRRRNAEADSRAEEQRLLQARLDTERKADEARQQVARDKIDAERREIEAERKKLEAEKRQRENELLQRQTAERVKRETEERIAREAKAKAEADDHRKQREAETKAAQDAAKDDISKVRDYGLSLGGFARPPKCKSESAEYEVTSAYNRIMAIVAELQTWEPFVDDDDLAF